MNSKVDTVDRHVAVWLSNEAAATESDDADIPSSSLIAVYYYYPI